MDKIMGIVRTVVAAAGGFLVALGVTNAEDVGSIVTNVEAILGAGAVIAAAAASVYAKVKGVLGNYGK